MKLYFFKVFFNYHFNINSFVCFLESTSSETKKSKLQRQKTEIISSPAKEDDESKIEIVEEKPEKKPVPKPRGPIQVVQKPDESAATDETKARSDWDSEDDTKEPSEKTEDPKTEIADEDSEEEEDEDSEEEDEDEEETGNKIKVISMTPFHMKTFSDEEESEGSEEESEEESDEDDDEEEEDVEESQVSPKKSGNPEEEQESSAADVSTTESKEEKGLYFT